MAVSFDSTKLAMFRDAQFASENSIANLGDDGLKAGGTYKNAFSAITRTKAEKAENNKVRTELLRSLGHAFGLSGMSEAGGKVSFSKDFMDQLESILGKDVFKRGDFKIGADGTVTSGRPLTSRRISAIVTKAETVSQTSTDVGMKAETVSTASTGAGTKAGTVSTTSAATGNGEYDAKVYAAKLREIQDEIAPFKDVRSAPTLRLALFMDESEPSVDEEPFHGPKAKFKEYFQHVGKCQEFLDKDFEGLISENEEWVSNERSGKSNEGVARYMITDPKTQARIPMRSAGDLVSYFTHTNPIGLFEPSHYPSIPRGGIKDPEGLKALKDYIRTTVKLYVQTSIDLYFDAKAAGKLDDYISALDKAPPGCMDAKASLPSEIRTQLGLLTDEVPDAAKHDSHTSLDECINEEIGRAINRNPTASSWREIADAVKEELVGQTRPIMTLDHSGNIVPLMEDGKQVVRAVTTADIDKIGQVCADNLYVF